MDERKITPIGVMAILMLLSLIIIGMVVGMRRMSSIGGDLMAHTQQENGRYTSIETRLKTVEVKVDKITQVSSARAIQRKVDVLIARSRKRNRGR